MKTLLLFWRALWRALWVLAGLALALWVLLLALVLGALAVLWALLRGQRPAAVQLRWPAGRTPGGARRAAPVGDVVDVQARELPESGSAPDQPPRAPQLGSGEPR